MVDYDRICTVMTESERAKFIVRVQANAKQNQVTGFKDGVLHVRIAAPPVEGKANEALIKFLSAQLGVSKSRVVIEKGLTAKTKTITVQGLSLGEVVLRLVGLTG